MREIARVAMGYFPTQRRIVSAISHLLVPPSAGVVTALDAGAGEGAAISQLRSEWNRVASAVEIKLYGVESDRGRAAAAHAAFAPSGGECLWSAIEDTALVGAPSVLWFNPPYDRVRGEGRTEDLLFDIVRDWPARGGHLVLIVPDYVIADSYNEAVRCYTRHYDHLGIWRYPEPEYSQFKQCVLVGCRREKALSYAPWPDWADEPETWPILPDDPAPVATARVAPCGLRLRRTELSPEVLLEAVAKSPVRGSLLRDAIAEHPRIERPLLRLKDGHLAMALAGGLCDGIVEANGERFMVKGSLQSEVRRVAKRNKYDADGNKTADVDVHHTVHILNVRCLRSSGVIENYSSHEDADEPADAPEPKEAADA